MVKHENFMRKYLPNKHREKSVNFPITEANSIAKAISSAFLRGGCQVISHVTQTTVYHYGITLDMFGMMAEPISPSEGIMFN